MKQFNYHVNYVEVNKSTMATNFGEIPFSTMAETFEEGRAKALEFAQSISRCYNDNDANAFYFRICNF